MTVAPERETRDPAARAAGAETNGLAQVPGSPPGPVPRQPRIFFGWYIVAGGAVLSAILGGLMFHAFGQYVVVFEEEFGWSRTALSVAFSVQMVESGLLGPVQGFALDRYGPRRIMMVGITIFAIGFLLLSRINTLPAFYGAFLVIALGMSIGSMMGVSVAVVNWFNRRRALAMAIMSLGFAAGGFLQPAVAWSLGNIGWRDTSVVSGLVVLFVGLPLAGLMRHRPEQYGLPRRRRPAGRDRRRRPHRTGRRRRRDQLHVAGSDAHARVLVDLDRPRVRAADHGRGHGALRRAPQRQPRLLAERGRERDPADHRDEHRRHAGRRHPGRPHADALHPGGGDARSHGLADRADGDDLGGRRDRVRRAARTLVRGARAADDGDPRRLLRARRVRDGDGLLLADHPDRHGGRPDHRGAELRPDGGLPRRVRRGSLPSPASGRSSSSSRRRRIRRPAWPPGRRTASASRPRPPGPSGAGSGGSPAARRRAPGVPRATCDAGLLAMQAALGQEVEQQRPEGVRLVAVHAVPLPPPRSPCARP